MINSLFTRLLGFAVTSLAQRKQYQSAPQTENIYLTQQQVTEIGKRLEEIRCSVMENIGQKDRAYILRTLRLQSLCEIAGRVITHLSRGKKTALAGMGLLSTSKIIDNMEIGHNVMHGQYDWMGEDALRSHDFEWDNVCPANQWRHSHNYMHHTFTNIRGKDRDLGYNTIRVDWHQPWRPYFLGNLIYTTLMMLFFEWGIMLHDAEISDFYTGRRPWKELLPFAKEWGRKAGKQVLKDFIIFPILAGKKARKVMKYNFLANIIRNMWTHAVIFCGHFPTQAQTFDQTEVENETSGEWYIRQMLGSCNIYGSHLFHFMTGNLSHQIEHHLYPDMPSQRYKEIAPQVRALCEEYGLPYNTGPFSRQIANVWWTIAKCSLPNKYSNPTEAYEIVIERNKPAEACVA